MKAAVLRPAVNFTTYRKPGSEKEEGSETKQSLNRAFTTAARRQTPARRNGVCVQKRSASLCSSPRHVVSERKRAALNESQLLNLTEAKPPRVSQMVRKC